MKTILHIIDTTGPGGAEAVFVDLATRLPADRYRSVVVIRGKGWVYEELCRRGVKPVIMDAKGSFNWRYLMCLRKLIREEKVDLIQSHLLGSNVYASLVGMLTGRPVVSTFHGTVDVGQNERFMKGKFHAINFGSNNIVAVSRSLRTNIIERTPLNASKTSVIYNGIEANDFPLPKSSDLRQQFGWSKEDFVIGSLGNIRIAKSYDILLEAVAKLKDRETRYRFLIAGQGKKGLHDDLLKQRSELGLENFIQFIGFHNDPPVFLSNLDMFLLSSTTEGFSIATIQAMASGLPVLVTRSGGPEEIVTHGVNGWLVEPGNSEAIADAIISLSSDSELMNRLAVCGREHATQTYSLEKMLTSYQELYEEV